jgi:outer membrane immunogenic protein
VNKYKGFLLATVGGVALAPAAQAADLPLKARSYTEPAPASWQGAYGGFNIGGASNYSKLWGNDDYSGVSFIGGGQIGYNWQQGRFVYGLEADISGLTKPDSYAKDGGFEYGSHISWLSTIRGRLGYAFGDRGDWLAYGTVGLAIGGVEGKYGGCPDGCDQWSYSKTKLGWAVGGGVEHLISRNWSVGLEALYVDLGTSYMSSAGKTLSVHNEVLIGRVRMNYKF